MDDFKSLFFIITLISSLFCSCDAIIDTTTVVGVGQNIDFFQRLIGYEACNDHMKHMHTLSLSTPSEVNKDQCILTLSCTTAQPSIPWVCLAVHSSFSDCCRALGHTCQHCFVKLGALLVHCRSH